MKKKVEEEERYTYPANKLAGVENQRWVWPNPNFEKLWVRAGSSSKMGSIRFRASLGLLRLYKSLKP